MEIKVLEKNIVVHDVPFEKIVCDNRDKNSLFIEFDDINEARYKIEFLSYRALKVTDEDCFDGSILSDIPYSGMMYELINSEWLCDLKDLYYETIPSGNLLDNVRHYMLGLGDYYAEIIARGYKLEKLDHDKE
jgi:hypothetical protein